MPVAAPISAGGFGVTTVNAWPRAASAAPSWAMNAGSAWVVALLRCEARGAAIASGRALPEVDAG